MTFNPHLDGLKIYEAGKPIELVMREYGISENDVVKLASNENPYGASPKVLEAVTRKVSSLYRYPDDSMLSLKTKLAAHYGVAKEEVIFGCGSDQVLELAIAAKCTDGAKLLMAKTTFAMYEIYGKQAGATILKTPSHEHRVEELGAMIEEHKPDILFLCTPNNPLGECLDRDAVLGLIRACGGETLVIVDGAYQEYAAYKDPAKALSPKSLIAEFPNLLYAGTFSKAYGLGGMRIGYGIAQRPIMDALYKLRPPFNVSTLALIAAEVALEDQGFVHFCVEDCFKEMVRFERFAKERGIGYIESYTNFLTWRFEGGRDSTHFAQRLLERGVIIRNLASYGLNAVRMTIGTPPQNDRFFALAADYFGEGA